jgi:hypothetical protein
MNYQRSDFNKCKINVFEKTGLIKLKFFKDIPEFKNISKLRCTDSILKYIVFFYDKGSPLFIDEDDILKRKFRAATLAGFEKNEDGKFDEETNDILDCQNKEVNKAILRYLKIINNHKWSKLCIFQDAYYSELERLQTVSLETDEGKIKKAEIMRNLKTMEDELKDLVSDITNQDTNQKLIQQLYDLAAGDNTLNLRPEDFAFRKTNISISRPLRIEDESIAEAPKQDEQEEEDEDDY